MDFFEDTGEIVRLTRECSSCNQTKEDKDFPVNSKGLRGRGRKCLECSAEWQRVYRDENPILRLAKKYKIETLEKSAELYNKNYCEICKRTDEEVKLVIDHCHKTEKVRDKLCDTCNKGLGQFYDSEERLLEAVLYLRKHRVEDG